MSRHEYVCSAIFHPLANALADCQTCGWPISRHHSSETTMQLYEKGPFGPEVDCGQCLHAQLTLGPHGWHCAACLRTFHPSGETGAEQEAVRLRYELKDVRAALQKRDQEVEEIGKQLHAANNEIMSVRMERNELKARIEAMEVSDSMKTYEINVLTRENRQLDKQVKAADRQLLALRSEVEVKP